MPRVYLETSFLSACVSDRTDVASIYRRDLSREWWTTQRQAHELLISPEVLGELGKPDDDQPPTEAQLATLESMKITDVPKNQREAKELIAKGVKK